jgi:hypothetical protein
LFAAEFLWIHPRATQLLQFGYMSRIELPPPRRAAMPRRRAAVPPLRRVAKPPCRRPAAPPCRRAAAPPRRHAATPPRRHAAAPPRRDGPRRAALHRAAPRRSAPRRPCNANVARRRCKITYNAWNCIPMYSIKGDATIVIWLYVPHRIAAAPPRRAAPPGRLAAVQASRPSARFQWFPGPPSYFYCPRSSFKGRCGFRHARNCIHSNILFLWWLILQPQSDRTQSSLGNCSAEDMYFVDDFHTAVSQWAVPPIDLWLHSQPSKKWNEARTVSLEPKWLRHQKLISGDCKLFPAPKSQFRRQQLISGAKNLLPVPKIHFRRQKLISGVKN